MINWIKRLFKPRQFKQRDDLFIETDDDTMADVIAECYRTGKVVMKSEFNGTSVPLPTIEEIDEQHELRAKLEKNF